MSAVSRYIRLIPILMAVLALPLYTGLSCSEDSTVVSVYAAAGARPPLDEICRRYEEQCSASVQISYGGGGEVLNQMVLSRSGDIYIAPEQRFIEIAVEKQAIYPDSVKTIAYMVPVIAVPAGNPLNITTLVDLAAPGIRVAVTRPETTLLGQYAPEIFAKAGLSDEIAKNVAIEAARPDSLLNMLIMGQVDAGIIWHFYATQYPEDIEVIYLQPEQLTGIGEMQIAVSSYTDDMESARKYIDFITSDDGEAVFSQLGYYVDYEEVKTFWQ
jgi:molybdate transport system substrate-binding protein